MAGNKRQVQEINAGSMADIAFLLLIFFLVATTMSVDTGLQRVLPPIPENIKTPENKVKERNLMLVFVSKSNNIMITTQSQKNQVIDIRQLKDVTKQFILNAANSDVLPEKNSKEFDLPGGMKWVYPVSEGIISLQNDTGTSYEAYIMVQNELTRAFNEIRDEVSMQKFNGAKFAELPEDTRKVVASAIQTKISEAEPRNTGGK